MTVSRSPGQHSNSFGIALCLLIYLTFTDMSSIILLTIAARVHAPSVPPACFLLRPVGVGHVGRQEVVCAGTV